MTQQYDEPQQGQPYYPPPFGQDTREGSIEEVIHRNVTKRMRNSREPGRMPEVFTPSRSWGSIIIAGCAMALAAATLAFAFVAHNSSDSQITQLKAQVTGLSQEVQAAHNLYGKTVNGLTAKVNAMVPVVAGSSQYNSICSQYLTGANGGPTTFYFACTDTKPGH